MLPSLIGLDGESICAPPLGLPWPQVTPPGFSEAQTHVLQFIRFGLLAPLEADSSAGAPYGVDAVSDSYSKNAILTISLTSPEAAVSTPMRGGNGASNATQQRSVIRDIVSLRLKQTESNHNLLHGLKASVVACGRTKVCSQMEHWLYPKSFRVRHHLHSSPSVQFLDNTYLTEPSQTAMKVPVTIVTLHGIMAWTSTSGQGGAHSADQTTIQRNFTRVLSVMQAEAGRWLIANDMVSLYPLLHAAPTSSKGGSEAIDTDPLKSVIFSSTPAAIAHGQSLSVAGRTSQLKLLWRSASALEVTPSLSPY
nr:unnamed protein product [Trypanosoma congolense IL3000]